MKALLFTLALLPLTAGAVTRTFTGNGADTNWSTTANWSPAAVPAAADSLVFIAGGSPSNNNLSAATFHDFDFNARHVLSGNAFTITHGITSSPVQGVTINPNITLGLDQVFSVTSGTLTCAGTLSLNGRALTAAGAGTLVLGSSITGNGTASRIVKNGTGTLRISTLAVNAGGITVNDGTLDVPGLISGGAVTLTGGQLTGDGTLNTVTATGGEIIPTGGDLSVTGALTLGPAAKVTAKLTGPGAADIVTTSGPTVNLGDAELVIDSSAYQPLWDEDFTVLTKGTSGAITGTFKNLPQGAEVQINATTVGRISYTGGNGNDVTLDIISTTRQWDGGNVANDNWDEAENWTLNIRPNFGDVLDFPPGIQSTDRGLDNNFPNDTIFRQLVFRGDDYTVRGNRFKLSHGFKLGFTTGQANIDTDMVLAVDQTFDFGTATDSNEDRILHFDLLDNIDTAGHTLRLAGTGTMDGSINGSGGITVPNGADIKLKAMCNYTGLTLVEAGGNFTCGRQIGTGIDWLPGSPAGPSRIAGRMTVFNEENDFRLHVAENFFLVPGGTLSLAALVRKTGPGINEMDGTITLEGPGSMTLSCRTGHNNLNGIIGGTGTLLMEGSEHDSFLDGPAPTRIQGAQSNTFTGSLTLLGGDFILEKNAPGVLAVPCASLIITEDKNNDTLVETQEDEQIADNCAVTVGKDSSFNIGNITARTETIGALTVGGGTTAIGPGIFGASNSTLIVTGNITVPSGPANFGADLEVSNLRITATPCDLNVGVVATTDNADLLSRSTITRTGAATFRRTGPGIALFLSPVTVPFELLAGETFFRNAGGSPITLNGGAVGGNGTVGSIASLAAGGRVLPGERESIGILSTGNLTWNAGTTLRIKVANSTSGSGHDRVLALGTVSLGNATLQLVEQPGFNVAIGGQVFPLLNDGADATNGTFAGLPEGTFIPASTNGWRISYHGGDGNDVVLTRATTPPVEVQPVVTTVTFGNPNAQGNRAVAIAGKGTPGASYRLENSVNLSQWTPEGTAQTANATTGALSFSTTASPPVRPKQFWRFRKQ